jgi:hypothetical protein
MFSWHSDLTRITYKVSSHWPNCNWCGQTNSAQSSDDQDNGDDREQKVHTADRVPDERKFDLPPGISPDNPLAPLYARYRRDVDPSDPFHVAPESNFALGLLDMMGDIFDLFVSVEKKELGAMEGTLSEIPASISSEVQAMRLGVALSLASSSTITTSPPDPTEIPTLEATLVPLPTPQVSMTAEDPTETLLAPRGLPNQVADMVSLTESAIPTLIMPTHGIPPAPTTKPDGSTTSSPDSSPGGIYDPTDNPLRAHKPSKTTACNTSPTSSMAPSASKYTTQSIRYHCLYFYSLDYMPV